MATRRGASEGGGPIGLTSLISLLKQGQTAVPAVKYAAGVVGIAAAAGIVNLVLGHTRASVISISSMFVAMVLLFAFSRIVANGASASVNAAANVLLWVVVALFSVGLILCLSAISFGVPKGLHDFLLPDKELTNSALIERVMLKDTVDDARDAMDELAKRCPNNCDDKRKIVQAIQHLLRHTGRTDRELKITAIAALRIIAGRNLNEILSDEFEEKHVVEVDFTRANLSTVSFRSAFGILNTFAFADLSDVDFSNAYLRGSDFRNAKLSRAKFIGADWFNGFNLNLDQLKDVRGMRKCPDFYSDGTFKPFIAANDDMYMNKFAQYGVEHQSALRANWTRYASPGGACELAEKLQ